MTGMVKENKLILLRSLAYMYRSHNPMKIASESQIPILEPRSTRK